MGSFFDRMAVPYNLAYCASKAAVGAMTRCLAAEWADKAIRVINIAPGYVETALNREFLAREDMRRYMESRVPLKRAGRPEEVARAGCPPCSARTSPTSPARPSTWTPRTPSPTEPARGSRSRTADGDRATRSGNPPPGRLVRGRARGSSAGPSPEPAAPVSRSRLRPFAPDGPRR